MKAGEIFVRLEKPWWDDKPVALIGGGPSLKGVDLSSLASAHAVAVKGTMFDHAWAECGFGLDAIDLRRWWKKFNTIKLPVYWAVGANWKNPSTLKWPKRNWVDPRKVNSNFPTTLKMLKRQTQVGLSDDASLVHSGGSSGYGALNLAYLKRARRIVLFGYDYAPSAGEWHTNGSHYDPLHVYNPQDWSRWAAFFDLSLGQLHDKGIEVLNASPTSAIKSFRRVTVEEGLRLCET